jgi:hypothetical protein
MPPAFRFAGTGERCDASVRLSSSVIGPKSIHWNECGRNALPLGGLPKLLLRRSEALKNF